MVRGIFHTWKKWTCRREFVHRKNYFFQVEIRFYWKFSDQTYEHSSFEPNWQRKPQQELKHSKYPYLSFSPLTRLMQTIKSTKKKARKAHMKTCSLSHSIENLFIPLKLIKTLKSLFHLTQVKTSSS